MTSLIWAGAGDYLCFRGLEFCIVCWFLVLILLLQRLDFAYLLICAVLSSGFVFCHDAFIALYRTDVILRWYQFFIFCSGKHFSFFFCLWVHSSRLCLSGGVVFWDWKVAIPYVCFWISARQTCVHDSSAASFVHARSYFVLFPLECVKNATDNSSTFEKKNYKFEIDILWLARR